ncbi:MAG: hypothetical protein PUI06_07535 [Prevotella sp.]|nr:hypothetical protein [Prevotella sp.]MDY5666568.1 hypothetical protein [Alloprevotella sp.]
MSLAKYESEVKIVPQSQSVVYSRFDDLNSLSAIKDRLSDPTVQQKLSEQVPADKLDELRKYAQGLSFEADAIHIASPMGNITLRVVEREAPKCIKFASEGSPVQLYVWIQLLPHGAYESKLRVTVGAEVNFFMKGMVAKPLQQAADGLANMLSALR